MNICIMGFGGSGSGSPQMPIHDFEVITSAKYHAVDLNGLQRLVSIVLSSFTITWPCVLTIMGPVLRLVSYS